METSQNEQKPRKYLKGADINAILKDLGGEIKYPFPHEDFDFAYTYDEERGCLPSEIQKPWCNFEYWENSELLISEAISVTSFLICFKDPISIYPRIELDDIVFKDSNTKNCWKQTIGKGLMVTLTNDGNVFIKRKKTFQANINGKYCEESAKLGVIKALYTREIVFKTREHLYEKNTNDNSVSDDDRFNVSISLPAKSNANSSNSRIVLNFKDLCQSFSLVSNKTMQHEVKKPGRLSTENKSISTTDVNKTLNGARSFERKKNSIKLGVGKSFDKSSDMSQEDKRLIMNDGVKGQIMEICKDQAWRIIENKRFLTGDSLSYDDIHDHHISRGNSVSDFNLSLPYSKGALKNFLRLKKKTPLKTCTIPSFLELFEKDYDHIITKMLPDSTDIFKPVNNSEDIFR